MEKGILAVLPAGKYYIGDVTYILLDDIRQKVLIEQGKGNDGVYYSDRGVFALASTYYGDGLYSDVTNTHFFSVDGGNIGIVEEKIAKPNGQLLIDSISSVTFRSRIRGTFTITFTTADSVRHTIRINTQGGGTTVKVWAHNDIYLSQFLIYAKRTIPEDVELITCTLEEYDDYLDWFEWYTQLVNSHTINFGWYYEKLHISLYFLFNRADLSQEPFNYVYHSRSEFERWLQWARPNLEEIERICEYNPLHTDFKKYDEY